MLHKGNFSLTLQNQQDMSWLSWYFLHPNTYKCYQSISNNWVLLKTQVIKFVYQTMYMLSLKNFNFPSLWKGWNKWSDCLWPSKGKWNKNSWVGQGDESCYSQLIKKGQRARLQELGQLSGSKAISRLLSKSLKTGFGSCKGRAK